MHFSILQKNSSDRQKWRENLLGDSAYILKIKNFTQIALPCIASEKKCVFEFYAEIQDGC